LDASAYGSSWYSKGVCSFLIKLWHLLDKAESYAVDGLLRLDEIDAGDRIRDFLNSERI